MARIGAQRLSEAWSRPVIVDNRPGAGGAIAFETVAHAEPDGYTLLLGSTNLTVLPDITKVAYDPIKDFAPISLMSTAMNILLVHPSVPADSVKQLIALAKAQPGKLSYASSSVATSSHLVTQLHHAALVGFDLRQMEGDVSVELLEKRDPIANQDRQNRITNLVG